MRNLLLFAIFIMLFVISNDITNGNEEARKHNQLLEKQIELLEDKDIERFDTLYYLGNH